MAVAASNLEQICNAIDNGEIDNALSTIFNEARLDLSASVARRICFIDLAEERISTLKRLKKEFGAAQTRLEYALERVEKGTIDIMESHKELPYKSELGRLSVRKNSSSSTSITEIEIKKVSIENVVDAGDIHKHAIDERFYEVRSYYSLLIHEIKKAIENGESIPWATLERGSHLRISR